VVMRRIGGTSEVGAQINEPKKAGALDTLEDVSTLTWDREAPVNVM